MKILHSDKSVAALGGSREELVIIAQSLNEVMGGAPTNAYVPGERFLSVFGISLDDADKLHMQLLEGINSESHVINCTEEVLLSLHKIVQYCLDHIEDEEYSTLIGVKKDGARELLNALRAGFQ